jgi:hypothetical protein
LCPWKSNQQLVAIHHLQILKVIKSWGITYLNLIRKGGKMVYYIPYCKNNRERKYKRSKEVKMFVLSSLFSHWSTVNFQQGYIRYFRRHAETYQTKMFTNGDFKFLVFIIWWLWAVLSPPPPSQKKMGLCMSSTGFFFRSFFRRQDPKFRPLKKNAG